MTRVICFPEDKIIWIHINLHYIAYCNLLWVNCKKLAVTKNSSYWGVFGLLPDCNCGTKLWIWCKNFCCVRKFDVYGLCKCVLANCYTSKILCIINNLRKAERYQIQKQLTLAFAGEGRNTGSEAPTWFNDAGSRSERKGEKHGNEKFKRIGMSSNINCSTQLIGRGDIIRSLRRIRSTFIFLNIFSLQLFVFIYLIVSINILGTFM